MLANETSHEGRATLVHPGKRRNLVVLQYLLNEGDMTSEAGPVEVARLGEDLGILLDFLDFYPFKLCLFLC